jgi:hypothetical protein
MSAARRRRRFVFCPHEKPDTDDARRRRADLPRGRDFFCGHDRY